MIKLSKNTHKYKFNRRRALECKFVEKSKKNPGYLKYTVTIGEKDGTTNNQPAYGRDMQDALSRLIKKEFTTRLEKKVTAGWLFIIWLAIMGWPAMLVETEGNPWYIALAFGGVTISFIVVATWYNHINKGE
tara:strand:- start:512 stop:907 length:396 start_codon:yes stop_codon:yes gene_type:complete